MAQGQSALCFPPAMNHLNGILPLSRRRFEQNFDRPTKLVSQEEEGRGRPCLTFIWTIGVGCLQEEGRGL